MDTEDETKNANDEVESALLSSSSLLPNTREDNPDISMTSSSIKTTSKPAQGGEGEEEEVVVGGVAAALDPTPQISRRAKSIQTTLERLRRCRRRRHRRHHATGGGLVMIEQVIEGLSNFPDQLRREKEQQQQEEHGVHGISSFPAGGNNNDSDLLVRREPLTGSATDDLDPPLTRSELRRDIMLDFMASNKWILLCNSLVLFLVVTSGAIFFFFLMGWQSLCRPRTDCEPRNQIYNISIHILTALFSYMSTVVMPWRWAHSLHTLGLSCPYRSNDIGMDLNGLPSNDPWFHIPSVKRGIILFFLLFNCFFQYANQVFRGYYWSYQLASDFPGSLYTSIFFALSFLWAIIGAVLYWRQTYLVRRSDPQRFGPGPLDMIQEMWNNCRHPKFQEDADADDGGVNNAEYGCGNDVKTGNMNGNDANPTTNVDDSKPAATSTLEANRNFPNNESNNSDPNNNNNNDKPV